MMCPFCDGQGVINKAKVIKNDMLIFICDECDTVWLTNDIREDNCVNYHKFINEQGLKGLWSELYDIKRI